MAIQVVNGQIVVKPTSQQASVKVFNGLPGRSLRNRGDWATAQWYDTLDFFRDPSSNKLYNVLAAHTSTSIAGDLVAARISEMLNISQVETLRNETITKASEALSSANASEVSRLAAGVFASNSEASKVTSVEQALIATTKASEASASATNAASSETGASNSAATATTQALIATNKAADAAASAIASQTDLPIKLSTGDVFADFVANGLLSPTSGTLASILSPGEAYVYGKRVSLPATYYMYPASSDTYVDLSIAGGLTYQSVANGAAAPAVSVDNLRLQVVVTNATAVTSVTRLAAYKPFVVNWSGHVGIGVDNPYLSTLQVAGDIYNTAGIGFYVQGEGGARNVIYRGGSDFFIFRNYNQAYTLQQIWAPPGTLATEREATLALVRGNEPDQEYLDLYNNGYATETQFGIRIQKRGTGVYRDFVFDQFDGVTKSNIMTLKADKSVSISGNLSLSSGSKISIGGVDFLSCYTAIAGGTGDAITTAFTPAITSFSAGPFWWRASAENTITTPTLKQDGLVEKTIVKGNNLPLIAGDIPGAGSWMCSQYDATLDKYVLLNPATGVITLSDYNGFYKLDSRSVAFTKTAAGTISIKAGTKIMVAGVAVSFAVATAVVMPALTAGTDYAIYACTDGTVRADASFTAPTGYTTANSRMIGGFHYGLVAPGTTVAGGSFATTGNGMIWTQADVDLIAGVNAFSLWDLKWRAASNDPLFRSQKGFFYCTNKREWQAIYFCSTDPDANGLSKAGTNIFSGTVLPKIPVACGGNGSATYSAADWWAANEIAGAYGARLIRESGFVMGAFGVTENQSIDSTAATYPTTQRNPGYTSKYGMEQASGHHYTWGEDTGMYYDNSTWSWKNVNGGRGQIYSQGTYGLTRVILGGGRTNGVYSGSRCSGWSGYPWDVSWGVGLRAACDHLALV